jgi:hypothetical protein
LLNWHAAKEQKFFVSFFQKRNTSFLPCERPTVATQYGYAEGEHTSALYHTHYCGLIAAGTGGMPCTATASRATTPGRSGAPHSQQLSGVRTGLRAFSAWLESPALARKVETDTNARKKRFRATWRVSTLFPVSVKPLKAACAAVSLQFG